MLEGQVKKYLPFESRYQQVAGYRMHYVDEGSGPVVLLLHGNPTWCYYHRHLIEALRGKFRVIAPDFIGCGLSDHPADAHFRAIDRIEHVGEFVRGLGLTRYSMVMHDWGGPIGTGHAVRNSSAIEKLVYLNTTLTETESLPLLIKTAAHPWIGKFLTKTTKRFLRFMTDLGVYHRLSKQVKKGYLFPYRTRARRTAIWDFVADIPFNAAHPSYSEMLSLADDIRNLSHVPVQIVWGMQDLCFHREMLNNVMAHYPQARVLEIPKASHLVLEDAKEECNSTILNFLTEEAAPVERNQAPAARAGNELYLQFTRQAQSTPQEYAAIVPSFLGDNVKYSQVRYDGLDNLIRRYERGLSELGLQAGDKALMLVSPGIEFLALSYAVMGRGAVPVFLDPGMGRAKLFSCIEFIRPDVFIGSPRAQLLRMLKGKKLLPALKFHLTASDWFIGGGPTTALLKKFSARALEPAVSGDTALIAFTSGATGAPKGVIFTNAMIREQLRIFKEEFQIEAGKKDLPLLPIFSLFNLAMGVCSVFPPMDPARPLSIEPQRIVKLIEDLRIDYSFGSPTLWNKIAEYCVRSRTVLQSMKRIFMAGAPVTRPALGRVSEILSGGVAFTPYGATEALPVTLISAAEILDSTKVSAQGGELGTLVGKPVRGVELKVVRAAEGPIGSLQDAEVLPPLQIGEVIVRGANVSAEYFNLPGETEHAKIMDAGGFWHRMGDMGYLDEAGCMYMCGRKAHAVKTPQRTLYSVPTERIFNAHEKVARSALIALGDGSLPGIVVEPFPQHWPASEESRHDFLQELRALAQSCELTAEIDNFFFHPSFPVDGRHSAKIFRDQLGQWAQQQFGLKSAA